MIDYKQLEQELIQKYGKGFDKVSSSFGVCRAEDLVIKEWLQSLVPEIRALQPDKPAFMEEDEPYYGAIGGGVTYSFTPTGLGTILTVKEAITGKELNVTDALGWYLFD